MNRQCAFEGSGKFLKGGLHCHTTRSDGRLSPEETMLLHKENGYDFLALTDHRFYNFRSYAPQTGITVIPGMEFDSLFSAGCGFRCFHTVSIGSDGPSNGFKQDDKFDPGKSTKQEEYQKYLDWLHENNNLTIYCHPEWSSTPARYFDKLTGNFAMEIWNSGCAIENDMDTDAAYWDELLGMGIKIFGVATDDGHRDYHHCKGWVMVRCENSVDAILKALTEGRFYSSCGPVIKDFYVDNDIAYLDAEPCCKIRFHSDRHPTRIIRDENGNLTHAEFQLNGQYDQYLRASVVDAEGRKAWTNPIYLR